MIAKQTSTSLAEAVRMVYLPLVESVSKPDLFSILLREDSHGGEICQWGERLLQMIWNEQAVQPHLTTVCGQSLRVISPGTWNRAAGPDFHNAVLEMDGVRTVGDVEIHRRVADWYAHGHEGDPAYEGVVLHVVWQAETERGAGELPPCLALSGCVDDSWTELCSELETNAYPYARQVGSGLCALQFGRMGDVEAVRVLQVAGMARFLRKAGRLRQAMIAVGAGQALYEAVFDALGYRANRTAFRGLARAVPLRYLRDLPGREEREAALFGVAGLLVDPVVACLPAESRARCRRLWDAWWMLGREPLDFPWARGGARPFNSPERRLAAGCAFLHGCAWSPAERVAELARRAAHGREMATLLAEAFAVRSEWECWTDFQHRLRKPGRLLGDSRIRDLLVNVALPFVHALAEQDGDAGLARSSEEAYVSIPRLQENRLTTEAAHRFFFPASRAKKLSRHACEQQGLLGLYQDFCAAPGADCSVCPLGTAAGLAKMLSPG